MPRRLVEAKDGDMRMAVSVETESKESERALIEWSRSTYRAISHPFRRIPEGGRRASAIPLAVPFAKPF